MITIPATAMPMIELDLNWSIQLVSQYLQLRLKLGTLCLLRLRHPGLRSPRVFGHKTSQTINKKDLN